MDTNQFELKSDEAREIMKSAEPHLEGVMAKVICATERKILSNLTPKLEQMQAEIERLRNKYPGIACAF